MTTPTEKRLVSPKELLAELQALLLEAEKMTDTTVPEPTIAAMEALRTRFGAAYERVAEACAGVRQKVAAGAECTDRAIRSNPYQAVAIAAGAGLLAGVLLGRRMR